MTLVPRSSWSRLQQLGSSHDFTVVDVADDHQVKIGRSRSLTSYGPPDLLINNAALIIQLAPLWQVAAPATTKGQWHAASSS